MTDLCSIRVCYSIYIYIYIYIYIDMRVFCIQREKYLIFQAREINFKFKTRYKHEHFKHFQNQQRYITYTKLIK